MKVRTFFPVFLSALALLGKPAYAQHDPVGIWVGALAIKGMELRVVFNVTAKTGRVWSVSMDSPDQGVKGIPVEDMKEAGDSVKFDVPSVLGGYEGVFVSDSVIEGTWTQSTVSMPLRLNRSASPPEVSRPQEPKPPFPYNEYEVTFRNEQDDATLAGTLTTPKTGGPFPAAVLISGSGPQDRDETIMNHRPFLVLADHLTRKGIAVLRYDDRGVGKSTGSRTEATSEHFMRDALAAVGHLKSRADIDPQRIGLIGHSEGGMIAPMAATRSNDVAFVVMLAGPGLTGEEILYAQGELIRRALGVPEEMIRLQKDLQKILFKAVLAEPDTHKARLRMKADILGFFSTLPDSLRVSDDFSVEALEASMSNVNTPWFRFFLSYDPRPVLRKVTAPVLALIGEKDLQVPAEGNLEAIENALREGGNNSFSVRKMPGLNHLFQTAETGSMTEYAKIEETFAPAALLEISSWLRGILRKR